MKYTFICKRFSANVIIMQIFRLSVKFGIYCTDDVVSRKAFIHIYLIYIYIYIYIYLIYTYMYIFYIFCTFDLSTFVGKRFIEISVVFLKSHWKFHFPWSYNSHPLKVKLNVLTT